MESGKRWRNVGPNMLPKVHLCIRWQLYVQFEVVTKCKLSKLTVMELTCGRVSHSERSIAAAVVFTDHPTLHGCCDLGGGRGSHCRLLTQRLRGETMGNNGRAQQLQGKEDIKKFFKRAAAARIARRPPSLQTRSCRSVFFAPRGRS